MKRPGIVPHINALEQEVEALNNTLAVAIPKLRIAGIWQDIDPTGETSDDYVASFTVRDATVTFDPDTGPTITGWIEDEAESR